MFDWASEPFGTIATFFAVAGWLVAVRYYHRLEKIIAEYEEILRARNAVTNEIAHDIKNPLTAVLCSAETLEIVAGSKLSSEELATLTYIREYGEQMLRLVSDFLDVNLAENGRLSCSNEVVALSPIVHSVVGLLRSSSNRKGISLSIYDFTTEARVELDPKHLKQILFNLIHNAIKFSDEGTSISVHLRKGSKDDYEIIIDDNGVGIDEAVLPFLFDPYSQAKRGLHHEARGTGIGLALVKQLVELNRGLVAVQSKLGQGTRFTIVFPSCTRIVSFQANAPRIALNEEPLKGQTVLLIDENDGARDALAGIVKALGAVVETADQIEDALQSLIRNRYDAVMIDMSSNDGSALALAKIIKTDLAATKTKIVLLGDEELESDMKREFGVDDCVIKPPNGQVLARKLMPSGPAKPR